MRQNCLKLCVLVLCCVIVYGAEENRASSCTGHFGRHEKADSVKPAVHPRHYDGRVHHTQRQQIADIPECGYSVCDIPTVIKTYMQSNRLIRGKNLKYRVVNIAKDDGSNPMVSDAQIEKQDSAINEAFGKYGIYWDLEHVIIRNDSLRETGVLFGCDPNQIGDGVCDPECLLYSTDMDGGDCDVKDAICTSDMIHDGQCQAACNTTETNWDGGDCCSTSPDGELVCVVTEIKTTKHQNRKYMTIEQFKDYMQMDNINQINVMFAEWTNSALIGLATFPWDSETYLSPRGGVVVKPREFGMEGHTATLIHELGHILGLWHIHHGISEVDCEDSCYEETASMLTGDLCSDTPPSPVNGGCYNPGLTYTCKPRSFPDAPIHNYMSYSNDQCMTEFTPQQQARMHCHIDHFLYRTNHQHENYLYGYVVKAEEGLMRLILDPRYEAGRFQVIRVPEFPEEVRYFEGTIYEDTSVKKGEDYSYMITVDNRSNSTFLTSFASNIFDVHIE